MNESATNRQPTPGSIAEGLIALAEQMVDQQRRKVVQTAQRINPRLTEDDVMDPHSFPELIHNPAFAFEDGLLAGLVSAQVAIQRRCGELLAGKE